MITVHWHLILYVAVMVYLVVKLFSSGEGGGDYSFDFSPTLWLAAMAVATLFYGGIFWW